MLCIFIKINFRYVYFIFMFSLQPRKSEWNNYNIYTTLWNVSRSYRYKELELVRTAQRNYIDVIMEMGSYELRVLEYNGIG